MSLLVFGMPGEESLIVVKGFDCIRLADASSTMIERMLRDETHCCHLDLP